MTKDQHIQATTHGALVSENQSGYENDARADERNGSTIEQTEKISASHLKLKQLSVLRNATAPKDKSLDKTLDLPREERLGKPLPLPDSGDYAAFETELMGGDSHKGPSPLRRAYLQTLDAMISALTKLRDS